MKIFSKLWKLLKGDRKAFTGLVLLSIVNSIFEAVGIGLVLPFVAIIINPKIVQNNKILTFLQDLLPAMSHNNFVILLTSMLIVSFIGKNLFSFFFQILQSRFVFNYGVKMGSRLFQNYLFSPYSFFLTRNTVELLDMIQTELGEFINSFLLHFFVSMTEGVTVLAYLVFLLWFDPFATSLIFSMLSISIIIFYSMIRKRMYIYGEYHREANEEILRCMAHGLGGIKEVKVLHKEDYFLAQYLKYAKKCAKFNGFIYTMSNSPRYFIEVVTIAVVLGVMIMLMLSGTSSQAILLKLSILGVASMRLLPSANRLVGSMIRVRYGARTLDNIYRDSVELDYKVTLPAITNDKPLCFDHKVELKQISFQYPNSDSIALDKINLTINKGQSVAFVGHSGAGKSTLVDIILGILQPSSGEILIDGQEMFANLPAWQNKLGYIPQVIYLADDTIKSNIAFGMSADEINESRVWQVLKMAHLDEVIAGLPDGIETVIGERGLRLSGGQRQRLGIARALYHNPEVLIMDEATSALDHQTEQEVIRSIDELSLEKTIIIIAHRFTTIRNCHTIFFMEKGRLVDQGNYEELLQRNMAFKLLAGLKKENDI